MTPPLLTRRGLLAGAATLAAAGPASAQFTLPFGKGRNLDLGNIGSALGDVFEGLRIDEDDEIKMGDTFYGGFVDRSGGRYRSRAAQDALREFAAPILATSERPRLTWEIALLNDNAVNAWAVPGGKLGINMGLVRYCSEPADLAAVIAHEFGHAELSHARGQMRSEHFQSGLTKGFKEGLRSRASGAGALTDQLVDSLAGPIFSMITSGYSQDREFEADAQVLTVFDRTGFQPSLAAHFYQTLLALVPKDAPGSTSLYPSHPGMLERIARLEKAAPSHPAPATPATARGWSELKRIFPTRKVPART
jgi:predicted Zn-dependent protease